MTDLRLALLSAVLSLLVVAQLAGAQATGTKAPLGSENVSGAEADSDPVEKGDASSKSLYEWLLGPLSVEDDLDGPINTDRPTFTPANTVVPLGRFQIESGSTYTYDMNLFSRLDMVDFPEMAVRIGIAKRLEFRTFWNGQNYARTQSRFGRSSSTTNGPSDMEVGFKSQLIVGDESRKWLPTTALITSVMAPVGGTSPYSSGTVNPYVNLIYGWNLTDRLTLAGSTGYLSMRQRNSGKPADSFERYNQSLVAFYSATDRLTFFHEWYVLAFTNAADNRPTHYMEAHPGFRAAT